MHLMGKFPGNNKRNADYEPGASASGFAYKIRLAKDDLQNVQNVIFLTENPGLQTGRNMLLFLHMAGIAISCI